MVPYPLVPRPLPPSRVLPEDSQDKPTRRNPVRRRCKNCGKMFNAVRPDHWFHTPACRKQFHKNEGAFGKVKDLVAKELREHLKDFRKLTDAVFLIASDPSINPKRINVIREMLGPPR
jgi:hypothetical protein